MDAAQNSSDAFRYLQERSYDVVFLDVRMPALNGIEFGNVLRRFATPPAIVEKLNNFGDLSNSRPIALISRLQLMMKARMKIVVMPSQFFEPRRGRRFGFGSRLGTSSGSPPLEQVFELLGEKAQAKKCEAMEGITKEGDGIVEETEDGAATRDVGIILAAQKVEHYEISTYGGLAQLATTLGLEDVAGLLRETLAEEKEADSLLTQIAEESINYEAAEESGD